MIHIIITKASPGTFGHHFFIISLRLSYLYQALRCCPRGPQKLGKTLRKVHYSLQIPSMMVMKLRGRIKRGFKKDKEGVQDWLWSIIPPELHNFGIGGVGFNNTTDIDFCVGTLWSETTRLHFQCIILRHCFRISRCLEEGIHRSFLCTSNGCEGLRNGGINKYHPKISGFERYFKKLPRK